MFETGGDLRHEHALRVLLLGAAQCGAVLAPLLLVLSKLRRVDSTVSRPELRTCLPVTQRSPASLD